ncbi:heme-binding domain-containing protein [Spongiimicrobium sp. 3-5]|uniref:heme-binding domain-containing protein n=1 Tax=Spongiimicrobium sp. 3-5 TaxID=3332596 RepID=UPI00397F4DF3
MKSIKKILVALLIIFIGMQFYRPDKNLAAEGHAHNFVTETVPSAPVTSLLEQTCYDCHSNNTVYPWYNNIAPVSYWLKDHIDEGKGHLNFSAWDTYDNKKKDHKLEEVVEMLEAKEMPLKEYTWTHEEARLTESQREAIITWAKKTRTRYQLDQRPE